MFWNPSKDFSTQFIASDELLFANPFPNFSSAPQEPKPELINEFYKEADQNIRDGVLVVKKPWLNLPAPQVHFLPPFEKPTLHLFAVYLQEHFKATDKRCGAPGGCRLRGPNVMCLCELCREWLHLRCIGDQRALPKQDQYYLCPLHQTGMRLIKMLELWCKEGKLCTFSSVSSQAKPKHEWVFKSLYVYGNPLVRTTKTVMNGLKE